MDLVHPDDFARTMSRGPRSVSCSQNPIVEVRLRHADGRWLYFECVVRNLIQHKNIGGVVYNARDITERKHAQEQLLFNATHDAADWPSGPCFVSGTFAERRGSNEKAPPRGRRRPFHRIDDFKVVNDCYGHAIGDALIKEVCTRLRACVRSDGAIARMGGDEFAVLVEDVADPSDAIRVAERISLHFERPFLLEGLEVFKKHVNWHRADITRDICGGGASEECRISVMYPSAEKPRQEARSELFDRTMHEQGHESTSSRSQS